MSSLTKWIRREQDSSRRKIYTQGVDVNRSRVISYSSKKIARTLTAGGMCCENRFNNSGPLAQLGVFFDSLIY